MMNLLAAAEWSTEYGCHDLAMLGHVAVLTRTESGLETGDESVSAVDCATAVCNAAGAGLGVVSPVAIRERATPAVPPVYEYVFD